MGNIERNQENLIFQLPISLSISQRDWTLHRQGSQDEARHNEKVKEAIKDNLENIVSDGAIITADPKSKKAIKIPLRSLELPHIRHKDGEQGVGTGTGNEEVGDIIGSEPKDGSGGKKAGQGEGFEHYEEITIEELKELIFADLGLPNLKPKPKQQIESDEYVFTDIRRKRSMNNLDVMRTIFENMRRNAEESGKAEVKDIKPEDYRVRTYEKEIREENAAVIIMMRDISASMGDFENYITRAFCWWTVLFLRANYPKVDLVFVVHDSRAQEVEEEAFFKRGSSGGTNCSSANKLALDILKNKYHPDKHNTYLLHFSDGDNWSGDDEKCVSLVQEMLNIDINQYGFIQIGKESSSLMSAYQKSISDPRFETVKIINKNDVWPGLQKIFDKNKQLTK